ncbi:DUF1206 domain-containing protein [Bifidobacterium pullorum]|uniref:DUF1206 domain-containing protein n=1 Tax=Bifidobacterium pullorum TaxID=78448 RepID=UPI00320A84B9
MMTLRINDAELEALLAERSGRIGCGSWKVGVSDILAGAGWPMAAFPSGWCPLLKWPLGLAGIGYSVYGLASVIRSVRDPYDHKKLLEEIKQMDRTEKRSSIVAVRDASGTARNRYLLYEDTRWGCDFFPNHDTEGTVQMEKPELSKWLSGTFEIPESAFNLSYIREMSHSKPSRSHGGEMRDYVYRLWVADVTEMPEVWKQPQFEVGGYSCRWETIAGMEADQHIMEINEDVVGMVKGFVH